MECAYQKIQRFYLLISLDYSGTSSVCWRVSFKMEISAIKEVYKLRYSPEVLGGEIRNQKKRNAVKIGFEKRG